MYRNISCRRPPARSRSYGLMPLPQTIMGTAHRYSLRRNHGLDWALFQSGHALSTLQFLFILFYCLYSPALRLSYLYNVDAALLLVFSHSSTAFTTALSCFSVFIWVSNYQGRAVRAEPSMCVNVISGGFIIIIFMHLRSLSLINFHTISFSNLIATPCMRSLVSSTYISSILSFSGCKRIILFSSSR